MHRRFELCSTNFLKNLYRNLTSGRLTEERPGDVSKIVAELARRRQTVLPLQTNHLGGQDE